MVALWISVCISVERYDCWFVLFIISYCFLLFWRGGHGCSSRMGEWGLKLSLRVLGDEEVAMSVFDIGIRFFYMLQYFNRSVFLVFLVSPAILWEWPFRPKAPATVLVLWYSELSFRSFFWSSTWWPSHGEPIQRSLQHLFATAALMPCYLVTVTWHAIA